MVLLDDVITTGATLAAATARLAAAGIPVHAAAVLAATRRTRPRRYRVWTQSSQFTGVPGVWSQPAQ